eukprot:2213075-Prymnesium_polylepis.1
MLRLPRGAGGGGALQGRRRGCTCDKSPRAKRGRHDLARLSGSERVRARARPEGRLRRRAAHRPSRRRGRRRADPPAAMRRRSTPRAPAALRTGRPREAMRARLQ